MLLITPHLVNFTVILLVRFDRGWFTIAFKSFDNIAAKPIAIPMYYIRSLKEITK